MEIFELLLKEENKGEGITAISLVKYPAIEQNWIAFNDEGVTIEKRPAFKFKTVDEDQRILAGPAMVPEKLIYRKNGDEEFFVFFSADTIRQLSERFALQGKHNNLTIEHEATVNDLSVVESWIVEDPEKDKSAMYGFNLPVGSWFVLVKVLNDDVWNLVKGKELEGFSVEGVFANQLINTNFNNMNKLDEYLEKIRNIFKDEVPADVEAVEFATVNATDSAGAAVVISYEGDELVAGIAATIAVDEEQVPIPTGEYMLEDGRTVVVAEDGTIGEVREGETEEEAPEAEGLKGEQIDKLIEAIADVVSTFKTDIEKSLNDKLDTELEKFRVEFNKPADEVDEPAPEDLKEKIVQGLGKFVKEQKKN